MISQEEVDTSVFYQEELSAEDVYYQTAVGFSIVIPWENLPADTRQFWIDWVDKVREEKKRKDGSNL